ncbi:MAG: YggT family protein [Candidatus Limnocylindrales bacterium]
MAYLAVFLRLLVLALYVVLLGRVLLSWVNPRFEGPVGRFFYQSTEPILGPIRRLLPSTGPIDWSPLVAFLALSLLAGAVGVG